VSTPGDAFTRGRVAVFGDVGGHAEQLRLGLVALGAEPDTLTLPPEITLTESIKVRCKGKVVRVDDGDGKVAVAAVIDEYEFLAEP